MLSLAGRAAALAALPLAALALIAIASPATAADPVPVNAERVKVGVLTCDIEGGLGFIIGSSRRVACTYSGTFGTESYFGRITKIGVDVGATGKQVMAWTVFAPATGGDGTAGLEGRYAGVSANVALGPGFGTNVLIGGSARRVALQPVSTQTGAGLNVAAAIAGLRLSRG